MVIEHDLSPRADYLLSEYFHQAVLFVESFLDTHRTADGCCVSAEVSEEDLRRSSSTYLDSVCS